MNIKQKIIWIIICLIISISLLLTFPFEFTYYIVSSLMLSAIISTFNYKSFNNERRGKRNKNGKIDE